MHKWSLIIYELLVPEPIDFKNMFKQELLWNNKVELCPVECVCHNVLSGVIWVLTAKVIGRFRYYNAIVSL